MIKYVIIVKVSMLNLLVCIRFFCEVFFCSLCMIFIVKMVDVELSIDVSEFMIVLKIVVRIN